MSHKTLGRVALLGALCMGASNAPVFGQGWYGAPTPYANACCPQPAQVVHTQAAVTCPQPAQVVHTQVVCPQVAQVAHVPVTEIHECKQTVHRPVVDTQMVEQPVTEYHPVTETRTAQVPTVSYQNVTECQTRMRDAGYWQTNYQCRPEMSPCQYDGRPGLIGWMNRTNYSLRMAFTPKVVAQRVYVPNMVAESVPVTRQVAIQGTQQVNYQVTRMVPVQTTRKVAVHSVRMVAQEITTKHPVTVMRQVTIGGSGMALAPSTGSTASSIGGGSLSPTPDPMQRAAIPRREATNRATNPASTASPSPGSDEFEDNKPRPAGTPAKRSSMQQEIRTNDGSIQGPSANTAPSAVRVGQWVARRRPEAPAVTPKEIDISLAELATMKPHN
jgi:hypothetical protein